LTTITPDQIKQALEAYQNAATLAEAARNLNIDVRTLKRRLNYSSGETPESIIHRNSITNGIPFEDVKLAWVKNDEVSMLWKRTEGSALSYLDVRDQIIEQMDQHSPIYKQIDYADVISEPHLLVIDAADVHIGKLSRISETGYEYNINEAVSRVKEGVENLLKKARPFTPEKIVFVVGNDILHIDHPHRTTTSGTPQDTDGQWWEMFLEAKKCYVDVIEMCTQIAPVHIVFCPSNHDYVSGWMLADTLSSWFRLNPNVTFGDNNRSISINHRKYIQYGNNLLMFTHGDGCKEKDIPSLMQYEARQAWGVTKYAYAYTHHVHHSDRKFVSPTDRRRQLEKDHIGITVISNTPIQNSDNGVYIETVRSPSPADGWHHRNGYVNKCAIEAFVHHHINGQIARLTEHF